MERVDKRQGRCGFLRCPHDHKKPRQSESILPASRRYPASLILICKETDRSGCGGVGLYSCLLMSLRQEACLGFREFKAV